MSYKIRHLVPPLIEDTNYSNLLHFLLIYNALALTIVTAFFCYLAISHFMC